MDLPSLRAKIDSIDGKLVQLLNERATVALHVGHAKRAVSAELKQQKSENVQDAPHVYAPGREKLVFEKVHTVPNYRRNLNPYVRRFKA